MPAARRWAVRNPQSAMAIPQCLRVFDTPCGRMGVIATARGLIRVLLPNEAVRYGAHSCRPPRGRVARPGRLRRGHVPPSGSRRSGQQTRPDHVGSVDPTYFLGMPPPTDDVSQAEVVADQAAREIREYLAGRRRKFTVPIDTGSLPPFHKTVLLAARGIPFGRTETYGALAARVGSPRGARAVGQAMARNPLAIVVPCHRVVAVGGGLGGYGGGLDLKRRLLALEGAG